MEAGGSAEPPIAPAPWRFFGDFLGVQKVTRRPQAEKSPCKKREKAAGAWPRPASLAPAGQFTFCPRPTCFF